MYQIPLEHVCPKCGFEAKYGPHDPFPAPVLSEGPICPKCYADFLRQHCGVMRYEGPTGPGYKGPEKLPGASIKNSYS
jgi:hypothetical protein